MTHDRDPAPTRGPTAGAGGAQGTDRLAQLLRLVESEPNDAFLLYGVAQEHGRRGATDEAVRWYDRCLAADPNYCYAYFHKARTLEEANRTAEAVAALKLGLERAKAVRDQHAASEIAGYLDQLSD